jgi:hypothetical protein
VIEKEPSALDAVALFVPFSVMLASDTGAPFSSTILPLTNKGARARTCNDIRQMQKTLSILRDLTAERNP